VETLSKKWTVNSKSDYERLHGLETPEQFSNDFEFYFWLTNIK